MREGKEFDLTKQISFRNPIAIPPLYGSSNFGKLQTRAVVVKYIISIISVTRTIYLGRRKTFGLSRLAVIDECNYAG